MGDSATPLGVLRRSALALALALLLAALTPTTSVAQDCYTSSIASPTPFMGNNGEIFRLLDGSLWEVKYVYEYLYEYYPDVVICPSRGRMVVAGRSLNVQLLSASRAPPAPARRPATPTSDVIESRIDGDFEGWDGDTIFKLANGQIWQQVSYAYAYSYRYSPKVIIFRTSAGYEMTVEGVSGRIRVQRLR